MKKALARSSEKYFFSKRINSELRIIITQAESNIIPPPSNPKIWNGNPNNRKINTVIKTREQRPLKNKRKVFKIFPLRISSESSEWIKK